MTMEPLLKFECCNVLSIPSAGADLGVIISAWCLWLVLVPRK